MKRREFITLVGGASLALWPIAGRAQQAMPVIGFLNGQSPRSFSHLVAAFQQGLAEEGFVESRNVRIDYRWAEGRTDALRGLAVELINRQVDVIVAAGGAHAIATAATKTLPIVFTTPGEPVQEGLVQSLNRPGGNATGISVFSTALESKRIDLLSECVPESKTIGVLFDPSFWTANQTLPELQKGAASLGKKLKIVNASNEAELDTALAGMNRIGMDAAVVAAGPFLNSRRAKIVESLLRSAMPTIFEAREFVQAGGLMSYGPSISDVYRWVGVYAGRILKGTKPAELPVLQPTKFVLSINLKTARALGLTVPLTLQAAADEVIE